MEDRVYPVFKALTLLHYAMESGHPADEILEGTGLTAKELPEPTSRISLRQLETLYANAAALLPEPDLGIRLGARFNPSDLGPFSLAVTTAATFGEAIDVIVEFPELESPPLSTAKSEALRPGLAALIISYDLTDVSLKRFAIDFAMSTMLTVSRQMLGPDFRYAEVHFQAREPDYSARHRAAYECPCHYDQPQNAVLFPAALLSHPLSMSNPITHALMRRQCEEMIRRIRDRRALTDEIAGLIEKDPARFSALDPVADYLNMSARTVRRRLEREGSSFMAVLDEARLNRAVTLLRDERLSVDETAHRLGFSSAANFRTAFKRWTGQTIDGFFTART